MDETLAEANAALVSGGAQDADEDAQSNADMVTVHCRWCGAPTETAAEGEDFLCDNCERYQDAMACPTCGQIARVSLMPEDMVPAPHAPARRRKAKED